MKPLTIFSRILAPTDLSDANLPALRYARLLADRFVAKLTVMYVDPIVYPVDYVGPVGAYLAATPEHQAELRDAVAKHAAPAMARKPYDIHVTLGQPSAAILAAARNSRADLLVVGTHLRRGWRRAFLGSVSEGVLHGSSCPVLTVASHDGDAASAPKAITNILCPVNFTHVARESLLVAAGLARTFGARLAVVHVLEDEVADEQKVRRWIGPDLQEVCSVREIVVRGGPAERVLDCADDLGADFLVVGAQHKTFRDTTVIGTTTERLIRHASCPVLVVPREQVQATARPAETEAAVLMAG